MDKPLPPGFTWLADETGPRILTEARRWHGTREIPGKVNNAAIMAWAAFVGAASYYPNDETPWCALFMAYVVKMAGFAPPNDPLRALAWLKFGTEVPRHQAMLGDILVMGRAGGGGHVTIYVGESQDSQFFYGLGGNQGDEVSIAKFPKIRIESVRRCPWRSLQPGNVRRILIAANGRPVGLSQKES